MPTTDSGAPSARNIVDKLGVTAGWLARAIQAPVRSRRGKLGSPIVMNPKTGFARKSYAAHVIQTLERNVNGGKYDVAQKLQAAGGLNQDEKRLIDEVMKVSRKRASLTALVAECGVDPARIVKLYAQGCVAMGKAEALAVASANLGSIARQLIRQAAIKSVSCATCFGSGLMPARPGYKKSKKGNVVCSSCKGTKVVEEAGPLYKFAVEKLLDMTNMGPSEPSIQVANNVAIQNTTLQAGGFMERLSKLTDGSGRVQHALPPAEEKTVEAEVVLEDHSPVPAG